MQSTAKELVLVIDMQNDFVTGSLGSEAAQAIVKPMAEYLSRCTCPLWFTLDTHPADYGNIPEAKKLPIPHCIAGTPGHDIVPALAPFAKRKDSVLVEKPTFGSTRLQRMVSMMPGLEKITVMGVCTDICVVSNALIIKAARPDIDIIVASSLCAGTSREAHEAALLTMKSCQITIL